MFFTIQKAEPLLRAGRAIVINASTVICAGMPNASRYSASKAAVRQLARNPSNELAPRNIRLNVVSPGYTRPPRHWAGYNDEQVEGFFGHVSGEVPLRCSGQPEETAKAVLFLASDDSGYVVGEELLVDAVATAPSARRAYCAGRRLQAVARLMARFEPLRCSEGVVSRAVCVGRLTALLHRVWRPLNVSQPKVQQGFQHG